MNQRAVLALRSILRTRRNAGTSQFMKTFDDRYDSLSKLLIKRNLGAPAWLTVKQLSVGDGGFQHFLQAKRLGTELYLIKIASLRFAAFVLHRPRALEPEFDYIGATGDSIAQRPDAQTAADTDAIPNFEGFRVSIFVQQSSFGGKPVFAPLLFQVNQTPLPLTEREVLQGREWQQVGFGEH